MSDPTAATPVADPFDSFTTRVTEYAVALAEIGHPEAVAAIETLAEAVTGMARAFEHAAAILRSDLPIRH